jgi:predicted RND superfamily exporter protein
VTSSYPPLRSIGVVSAVSVVTLAAASVFVLPALLMSEGPARAAAREHASTAAHAAREAPRTERPA